MNLQPPNNEAREGQLNGIDFIGKVSLESTL